MIEEVSLPEISESVETGEVVKVLVAQGESVEVDQPLAELETEKAVFEVPSPTGGRIAEIAVQAGDTLRVGDVLVKIETQAEAPEQPRSKTTPAESGAGTSAAAKPDGEGASTDESGTEGSGTEKSGLAEPALEAAQAAPPASDPQVLEAGAPPPRVSQPLPAAPSVRRLARELGVDLANVGGSGPGGRISAENVKQHARQRVTESDRGSSGPTGEPVDRMSAAGKWGHTRHEPLSKVRKVTARNMLRAWSTVPQVTQMDKADITELERTRKQFGSRVAAAGGKLTVTAIILKVVASALRVFPRFNATLDLDEDQIILKQYIHLGVAVDTDRGLLVPVIRDVDQKSITGLSIELNQIADKARNRKLMPEDMEGGTFTVSNLGGIGGTSFTPIVYPSQAAILGIARARTEPVYLDGAFVPRLLLPLALSYDHRLIDGADGARFLRWVCEALANPFLLVLEGESK